ncbi:hypothetical protein FTUN_8889 [Frigoriglobus tundricola]|uniref:Helix-turn-helix domain-containing protein n=2 Tax=Frigoriglobus tundricola TaxID=2774151 RepID=A0A6M5Z4A2_9BACT|nr:helix-turn-helix domain-containing protein [Frigoriglobus tundricola]QJX01250.1 hypothetical protein FTUN_8889 [Frigoriglobus tundricola]
MGGAGTLARPTRFALLNDFVDRGQAGLRRGGCGSAVALWLTIWRFAGEGDCARVAVDTLAACYGTDRRNVQRMLAQLEQHSYLAIVDRGKRGRGTCATYRLLVPAELNASPVVEKCVTTTHLPVEENASQLRIYDANKCVPSTHFEEVNASPGRILEGTKCVLATHITSPEKCVTTTHLTELNASPVVEKCVTTTHEQKQKKKEEPPLPPAVAGGADSEPGKRRGRSRDAADDPRAAVIPATLDTPEFREAWDAFIDHRAKKGKKNALTLRAAHLQLQVATKLGPAVAVERINRAIMNGWLALEYDRDRDNGPAIKASAAEPKAPQCRPLTPFESQHCAYTPVSGYQRDSSGQLVLDKLCGDLTCEHCRPRRKKEAA